MRYRIKIISDNIQTFIGNIFGPEKRPDVADINIHAVIQSITDSVNHHSHQTVYVRSNIHADVPRIVRAESKRLAQELKEKLEEVLSTTASGAVVIHVSLASKHGKDMTLLFNIKAGDISKVRIVFPCLITNNFQIVRATDKQSMLPSNLTILIAEDDDVCGLTMEQMLSSAGCKVVRVKDGEQALDMLTPANHAFDAVVADINMPGLSGLDLVKTYRFIDTRNPIPIILTSADASDTTNSLSMAAGSSAFISKPIRQESLLRHINDVCREHKARGHAVTS